MRASCTMGKMHDRARSVHDNLIPQFRDLRRISMRYQCILPLNVVKRYRCAVVGSAQGVLTVAITDQCDPSLIAALAHLTGCAIFPVWVNPVRMHLLIQRMERWQQRKDEMLRWPHLLIWFEVHMIVAVSLTR